MLRRCLGATRERRGGAPSSAPQDCRRPAGGCPMTDDVLATVQEIEARCAAATPGPWGERQLARGVRHLERNESDWYFEDLPEGYNLPGRQGDGGQRDG